MCELYLSELYLRLHSQGLFKFAGAAAWSIDPRNGRAPCLPPVERHPLPGHPSRAARAQVSQPPVPADTAGARAARMASLACAPTYGSRMASTTAAGDDGAGEAEAERRRGRGGAQAPAAAARPAGRLGPSRGPVRDHVVTVRSDFFVSDFFFLRRSTE